jgi:hypothetical protein
MKNIIKLIPIEKYSLVCNQIDPAYNHIPNWYKNSKTKIEETIVNSELNVLNPSATNSTYKNCVPFIDAMTTGYMFVLTEDIEFIKINDSIQVLWKNRKRDIITHHDNFQWAGLEHSEKYYPKVFKFENELVFSTPKGYSSLFTQPLNRPDLPFYIFSGVVDTDQYPLPVNFPFLIDKDFEGVLEAGTPLVQIMPFKRESWQKENQEFNEEYSKKAAHSLWSKIVKSYRNQFWSKKTYR